jgi:serine/threonine protein phosphatase PrpC
MSAFLEKPKTKKVTHDAETPHYTFGQAEMQGWRSNMEDSSIAEKLKKDSEGRERSVFGIFDGHGGNQVADFVKDHFVKELVKSGGFEEGDYNKALEQTFKKMDELMRTKKGEKELKSHIKAEEENKQDSEQFLPFDDEEEEMGSAV